MQSGCITRPIQQLQNRHKGQDIYLIAAGKSLDYVEPDFFYNKVTVGLNHAYKRFRTTYIVNSDGNDFQDCYRASVRDFNILIAARMGFLGPHKRVENIPESDAQQSYCIFEIEWGAQDGLDLSVIGTDQMVAGMSSITTAMNVCAYLGAANIVLCGVDGGTLDGNKYFDGYRDGPPPYMDGVNFVGWLAQVERQIIQVRERLKEVYGCNVVSLNPFINFGLEGHQYNRAS